MTGYAIVCGDAPNDDAPSRILGAGWAQSVFVSICLGRGIFVLRYWRVAPIDEIAEKLQFSKGKIKSSLFRTRRKLRDYLQEEGLC